MTATPTELPPEIAAAVVLAPDDVVVLRLAPGAEPTPDVLARARAAFQPRRVVVLTADVHLGHGAVTWDLP